MIRIGRLGRFLQDLAVLAVMAGCAEIFRTVPETETYAYSDLYAHEYRITLRKGKISDTSWLLDTAGQQLEVLKWNRSHSGKDSIDTLVVFRNDGGKVDNCKPGPGIICQRSTESILKVIRKATPGLKHTYNSFLRSYRFGGTLTLQFKINPAGEIRVLYLLGNTTGQHDFGIAIMKIVNTWKFEKVDAASFDVVTVPFTFTP